MNKKLSFLITIMIIIASLSACAQPGTNTIIDNAHALVTATPSKLMPIYRVSMFNGGEGWGMNLDQDQVYHTVNFGSNWFVVTPAQLSSLRADYPSVNSFFANGYCAWISMSNMNDKAVLLHTSDAGKTWETFDIPHPLGTMQFITESEGFSMVDLGAGAGSQHVAIYHSTDAGKTWELKFSNDDPSKDEATSLPAGGIKNGMTFLDTNTGFVSGSRPVDGEVYLFRSQDKGESWFPVDCTGLPDETASLMLQSGPVQRVGNKTAFLPLKAFLPDGKTNKTYICFTEDAGQSWSYRSTLENIDLISFGTDQQGLALGNGKTLRSEDGALTWKDVSSAFPPGAIQAIYLNYVSKNFVYMVASLPAMDFMNDNLLYMSATAGEAWSAMAATISEYHPNK